MITNARLWKRPSSFRQACSIAARAGWCRRATACIMPIFSHRRARRRRAGVRTAARPSPVRRRRIARIAARWWPTCWATHGNSRTAMKNDRKNRRFSAVFSDHPRSFCNLNRQRRVSIARPYAVRSIQHQAKITILRERRTGQRLAHAVGQRSLRCETPAALAAEVL